MRKINEEKEKIKKLQDHILEMKKALPLIQVINLNHIMIYLERKRENKK